MIAAGKPVQIGCSPATVSAEETPIHTRVEATVQLITDGKVEPDGEAQVRISAQLKFSESAHWQKVLSRERRE